MDLKKLGVNKFLQTCFVTAIFAVTFFTTQKASASDKALSVNVEALAYSGGVYNQANCEDLADKFDSLLLGDAACQSWAKNRKPSLEIFQYTNITNCSAGDGLCNHIESQADPEDYFLNATSDSVQDFAYAGSTTPDSDTFTRTAGQRICSYYVGDWCAEGGAGTRWKTDYMTSGNRDFLVDFFKTSTAPLVENTDGYFFDNMERGCGYAGQLSSGTADNGLAAGDFLSKKNPMEQACTDLKQNMADNLSYKYLENYGNYMISNCASGSSTFWNNCSNQCNGTTLSHSVAATACVSKGIFQEFGYRISNTYADISSDLGALKEIWDAWGQPSDRTYVGWWVGSAGAIGISGNSDRVKLFALGTQYLFQFPRMFMRYDAVGINNSPNTNDWFGAMGINIGSAQGDRVAMDSRTYKRTYSNGVAIVRYKLGSGDNYTDSASYELGGSYYTINSDGTIGSVVTSATLANSQAFVGLSTSAIVDGVCGSSDGQSLQSAPISNLCDAGIASSTSGTGPWNWTCDGTNGGSSDNCSALVLPPSTIFAYFNADLATSGQSLQIGTGSVTIGSSVSNDSGVVGNALSSGTGNGAGRISFPTAGNIDLDRGTMGFYLKLPSSPTVGSAKLMSVSNASPYFSLSYASSTSEFSFIYRNSGQIITVPVNELSIDNFDFVEISWNAQDNKIARRVGGGSWIEVGNTTGSSPLGATINFINNDGLVNPAALDQIIISSGYKDDIFSIKNNTDLSNGWTVSDTTAPSAPSGLSVQ